MLVFVAPACSVSGQFVLECMKSILSSYHIVPMKPDKILIIDDDHDVLL